MRRSPGLAALLSAAVVASTAGTASADTVNHSGTTLVADKPTVSLSASPTATNHTATVTLSVAPANDDGKSGCNLARQSTATFAVTSGNTAYATVTPTSVTFESCGDTKTLTVTGVGTGTAAISLTQTANNTDGTFDVGPATFYAAVASSCATAPAAPLLTASGSPDATSGWYNSSSGAAGFSLSPATSAEYSLDGGVTWTAYGSGVTFGTDGTRSVTARNYVPAGAGCARVNGTPTSAVSFQVDRTAPSYTNTTSEVDGSNGWNRTAVTAVYACSDAGSGLRPGFTCPTSETFTDGQSAAAATTSIADVAGNSTSTTRRAVKVDGTKPTVSSDVPAANTAGWNSSGFTVTYACGDANSGVVQTGTGSCPEAENLTEAGSPYAARTVTVTDAAGNTSESYTRREVKIDGTKPTASVVVAPGAGTGGWNNQTVTATYTCADSTTGSGLKTTCPADETFDADGRTPAQDFTVTDNADNVSETATRREVKLDTYRPVVTLEVLGADGRPATALNGYYDEAVTVRFTCTDPEFGGVRSGVQTGSAYSCPADIAVGADVSRAASSYEVRDVAGNATTGTVPAISTDTLPPVLTVAVTPASNTAGWNNSAVTVDWTCSDTGSGIDGTTPCPVDGTYGNGTDRASESATVKDLAGNSTGPVTARAVRVDTTEPSVSIVLRSVETGAVIAANDAGWFAQDVLVDFTCSDSGGSGLAADGQPFACPADHRVSDGNRAEYGYDVRDVADNRATGMVPALNIDTVKPAITVQSVSTPNYTADGSSWYRDTATVTFQATDTDGSGFAGSVAPFSRSTSGEGSTLTVGSASAGSVVDLAGNVADDITAGPYKVDASAPTITAAISGSPAYTSPTGTIWYRDSVTVGYTAADPALADGTPGSGLATPGSHSERRTVSGSYDATARDNVGHSASSNAVSYNVDSQSPSVALDCTRLPTRINKGDVVTLPWTASDADSGVASPSSGSFVLDTANVTANGSAQVAAAATRDNVGHASLASNTCAYAVTYKWHGFFQPIDNNPDQSGDPALATVWNSAKAGSTIPVKFDLSGDQGLSIWKDGKAPVMTKITCPSAAATADAVEEYSAATSGLKYDATVNAPHGQYNYAFKTTSTMSGTCQRLAVTLNDGTSHYAFFKLVK